jgi:hypothetical protein
MTELDMLRTIDPAAEAREDERDAERLLLSVLAEPRPTRRRRVSLPRRRLLVAIPAAAAALLVALPLALNHGGQSLAAKAYAATNPGDEILHEVSVSNVLQPSGTPTQTQESWSRPVDGTARSLTSAVGKKQSEIVIGADGVAHLHSPYATHPDEVLNPDGRNVIPVVRRFLDGVQSVTLGFRDDYAGQQLHDEGTTTLDGRTVHAYSADTKEWFPEDHAYATFHRTFYIDPDTTLPVAERVEMPGPNGTTIADLTVVKTYEKLPATPENLAKLTR